MSDTVPEATEPTNLECSEIPSRVLRVYGQIYLTQLNIVFGVFDVSQWAPIFRVFNF